MFIRKKKNKGGIVSLQIIDKSSGVYQVYQTIGSSSDLTEIEHLYKKSKQALLSISEQSSLPFESNDELEYVNTFINSINTGWKNSKRWIVRKIKNYLIRLPQNQQPICI